MGLPCEGTIGLDASGMPLLSTTFAINKKLALLFTKGSFCFDLSSLERARHVNYLVNLLLVPSSS
jgi:hypothetical protein